jgi:predicted transcriptional regulator
MAYNKTTGKRFLAISPMEWSILEILVAEQKKSKPRVMYGRTIYVQLRRRKHMTEVKETASSKALRRLRDKKLVSAQGLLMNMVYTPTVAAKALVQSFYYDFHRQIFSPSLHLLKTPSAL